MGSGGSQTAAVSFGGSTPSVTAATEEWNAPSPITVTFTDS